MNLPLLGEEVKGSQTNPTFSLKAGARKTKVRVHYWNPKDLKTGRETVTNGQIETEQSQPQTPRDVEKKGNLVRNLFF